MAVLIPLFMMSDIKKLIRYMRKRTFITKVLSFNFEHHVGVWLIPLYRSWSQIERFPANTIWLWIMYSWNSRKKVMDGHTWLVTTLIISTNGLVIHCFAHTYEEEEVLPYVEYSSFCLFAMLAVYYWCWLKTQDRTVIYLLPRSVSEVVLSTDATR